MVANREPVQREGEFSLPWLVPAASAATMAAVIISAVFIPFAPFCGYRMVTVIPAQASVPRPMAPDSATHQPDGREQQQTG